jgi:hypothetical protein
MARFQLFMSVKVQAEVFLVVMLDNVAAGSQHFGGPCCLHLQRITIQIMI